jgi:DNA-binding NtrC family response regulator
MPTILIVEDDASFRRVLEYQLTEAGYKTTVAENGKQALELFTGHRHQVVLTDLNLPEISGEEVLKHIKQQSPETPVIILTAFGSIESAVQAIKLGASQYLTKPVNEDVLLLTIENALKLANLPPNKRNFEEALSETNQIQSDSK